MDEVDYPNSEDSEDSEEQNSQNEGDENDDEGLQNDDEQGYFEASEGQHADALPDPQAFNQQLRDEVIIVPRRLPLTFPPKLLVTWTSSLRVAKPPQ